MCTIASVLGGFVGYAIGYFLFDAVGRPVLEFYHAMDKYEALKGGFAQWGAWIIILKGLTPIPFKLVTIMSAAQAGTPARQILSNHNLGAGEQRGEAHGR